MNFYNIVTQNTEIVDTNHTKSEAHLTSWKNTHEELATSVKNPRMPPLVYFFRFLSKKKMKSLRKTHLRKKRITQFDF